MATGTVEPSTHNEVQGSSVPPRKVDAGSDEKEKQMVASVRPTQHRLSNPFVITERPEEKQLGVSSRRLRVSDFALLRTLGTGTFRVSVCANLSDSNRGCSNPLRNLCACLASEVEGRKREKE